MFGVEVGLRSRCSLEEDSGYTDPLPLTQCSPVAKPHASVNIHICMATCRVHVCMYIYMDMFVCGRV